MYGNEQEKASTHRLLSVIEESLCSELRLWGGAVDARYHLVAFVIIILRVDASAFVHPITMERREVNKAASMTSLCRSRHAPLLIEQFDIHAVHKPDMPPPKTTT